MESLLQRLAIEFCDHKTEEGRSCDKACDDCIARASKFTHKLAVEARMNAYVFTGKWLSEIADQNL